MGADKNETAALGSFRVRYILEHLTVTLFPRYPQYTGDRMWRGVLTAPKAASDGALATLVEYGIELAIPIPAD